MKIQDTVLVSVLILTGIILATAKSHGDTDPAWLKSWVESEKIRPLTMTSSGRIAAENEPGIPMIIHGQLVGPDGKSAGGVVVHAYQRDTNGFEFGPHDSSVATWRLQGWVKTDADGQFEFNTIRPAPDHLGREGAHIHFTLDSVNVGRQWAPKIFFSDDSQVTKDQHRRSKAAGEFAWVREVRSIDSVQHVDVKIRLKEKADF